MLIFISLFKDISGKQLFHIAQIRNLHSNEIPKSVVRMVVADQRNRENPPTTTPYVPIQTNFIFTSQL